MRPSMKIQYLLVIIAIVANIFAFAHNDLCNRLNLKSNFVRKFVIFSFTPSFFIMSNDYSRPNEVYAADIPSKVLLTYKTGKNPVGLYPSDSKVGSKKDTTFLRCMSNCKSTCQRPNEGLAKNDCVQDCQDQCCDSYEQCSFKIKCTSGNSI
eukprot:gene10717-14390_t